MWKPFSSVPEDGTIVDLWDSLYDQRIPGMSFTGGKWINIDELDLVDFNTSEEHITHWANYTNMWNYVVALAPEDESIDILLTNGYIFYDVQYFPGDPTTPNDWEDESGFKLSDLGCELKDVKAWKKILGRPKNVETF